MADPTPSGQAPRRRTSAATLLFFGVAAVLVALAFVALVLNLARSGKARSHLATPVFVVGRADVLARAIARDGPTLFQDPLGRSRDIYLQHLGDTNWTAFDARAPGAARQCQLQWRRDEHSFFDPCDNRRYPADGAGLTRYPTRVDQKNRVVVDLRTPS